MKAIKNKQAVIPGSEMNLIPAERSTANALHPISLHRRTEFPGKGDPQAVGVQSVFSENKLAVIRFYDFSFGKHPPEIIATAQSLPFSKAFSHPIRLIFSALFVVFASKRPGRFVSSYELGSRIFGYA